ncbi:MAG: VWA domain-containing protein [Promethearchaeota archaeon]
MVKTRLFVKLLQNMSNICLISESTSKEIGVSNGDLVKLIDPKTKKEIICNVNVSPKILEFQIKVASDLLDKIDFKGLELIIEHTQIVTKSGVSQISPPPRPQSGIPQPPRPGQPVASQMPPPRPQSGIPQPPRPGQPVASQMPPPRPQSGIPQHPPSSVSQDLPTLPPPTHEPYPNKIDINNLSSQKPGSIILKVVIKAGCNGRIQLNSQTIQQLKLTHGMLIAWEDPLTRSVGSARITEKDVPLGQIYMDSDTAEDTNIEAEKIVVYSTEPPIEHQQIITLEVISQPTLQGSIMINPRNAATLQTKEGYILAFEDELTGAVGAGKVKIKEDLDNDKVIIDSELLEASGVGSIDVVIKKNVRQIIPLQSVEIGISPITGENIWDVISIARKNINSIKTWLSSYIIFKGIKLKWKDGDIAIEILTTTPDLTGDVFAALTPNTTITLKPVGLVTFNAILVIDISRSMMARDVEVKNIGAALEGIKAAMHAKEIQEFLSKFKPGINVPRRFSAAFAAILFLSEKVGRGFGEKVSIIRFADEAQVLHFQSGLPYMDSSSGEKGVLESCAKMIVEQIGNAYGQSTNMGLAMLKAQEILKNFAADEGETLPTMIVLLTDGAATDGDKFLQAIQRLSENPNVVIYIIGLGNPNDGEMKKAAALCGGEYFKPQDAGELLIWYSKRARDLQVKLKGNQ